MSKVQNEERGLREDILTEREVESERSNHLAMHPLLR